MEDSYELTPTADPLRTIEQPKKSNTGRNIAIVVGILILLALIGLAIYGMASNPEFTAVLPRDRPVAYDVPPRPR